jgi:hypothetical protein
MGQHPPLSDGIFCQTSTPIAPYNAHALRGTLFLSLQNSSHPPRPSAMPLPLSSLSRVKSHSAYSMWSTHLPFSDPQMLFLQGQLHGEFIRNANS